MHTVKKKRTGLPQAVGTYSVDGAAGGYFAGYTKCEQCSADLKIILPTADVRALAHKTGLSKPPKAKIRVKIAKRVAKWANGVTMGDMAFVE